MTQMNDATRAQVRAADPAASTWVSANAGSGKTRVLTDRVARLLLRGTAPQKILCLTYTKAAASHMQNQLFDRLGTWAMLDDASLQAALADLGETGEAAAPQNLRQARTLFARALETPGGLKIQTIHSFCANLLRRFPLESGVSPQFQEMDDRSAKRLRVDILETLAEGATQPAFDAMARYLSGDDTDALLQEITTNRAQFDQPVQDDEIWAALGLPSGYSPTSLMAAAFPDWAGDVLPDLIKILADGKPTDLKNRAKLQKINLTNPDLSDLLVLESVFVSGPKTKTPNSAKIGSFPTQDLRLQHLDLMEAVEQWMTLVETAALHRRALSAAEKTSALHQFAQAFLPLYAQRKAQHGWLDFDDLILKARGLLTDSATAQWVLFRLDGGIDHILVDEAQDTSPTQWDVITKLAEEFTTGSGARDVARTIFVVGDEKQSIYSFQGADPVAFDKMRVHFAAHLQQIQSRLERCNLLFSFRSADPILRLVDATLGQTPSPDTADTTQHRAFHDILPGRVDVWPFLPKTEETQDNIWYDPIDMPAPDDPSRILADQVADQIALLINDKTQLQLAKEVRPVRAGDFLILVQRRSELFHDIIKALKDREIDVAGADRLKIGGELAVKDLLALLSFMSLPEDDLSLACALRSPLFGLSEQQLYTLAQPRKASLWQALRSQQDQLPETFNTLNDLLKNVDFLRPFELLELILTRHNGRQNLIARLGAEAEDGIDALLVEALRYEQMEPPSLTGFLGWMSTGDVEIKRQMDAASNQVRVMTVHGAKGLESPIVILPDTANRLLPDRNALATLASGLQVWKPSADDSPDDIAAARDLQKQKRTEENQRLLYVALTRAENWLIVCGAGNQGKELNSWYNQVDHAMTTVGALPHEFPGGMGKRYQSTDWLDQTASVTALDTLKVSPLPEWVTMPAPTPKPTAKPLSPSDLGGAKILDGIGSGLDEDAAKKRGRQIHLLLEHLPNHHPDIWQTLAAQLLTTGPDQTSPIQITELLAEVAPILQNPNFADLFSADTLSEVPITARLSELDNQAIYGFIDRLVITKSEVLAIDFKSNADVPSTADDVPLGILRQMAAYQSALAALYPNHVVNTAILWTKTANLMPLPHNIVTQSLKSSSPS